MIPIDERWLNFTTEEYKERLAKVKKSMAEKGIDVLVLADPANMCYLTGYEGWSFYVHQCVVVFEGEEQPVWIGRGQDGNAARLTTWLDDNNIEPYTDDYVHSLVKHTYEFVADIIKARGYGNKVVATEMDAYYFTAKSQERLVASLPNATFKDGNNIVNWVRLIKSDTEVSYMKKAGKIVELGMEAAIKNVNIGTRQCDAAAEVYKALTKGTPEFGGEYASIIPLMPAGIRTTTPHLTWTDEKYKDGDVVFIEIGGNYKRYHCPLCRTIILGDAPKEVYNVEKVVVEGMTAALNAAKPGMVAEEFEQIWRKTIAKHGFIKESRIGYPTGLNFPPDWGEHTVSIRPGERTVFEPNMVFHMVPSIWLDTFGVEISETFRITENGCESLTKFERSLIVK